MEKQKRIDMTVLLAFAFIISCLIQASVCQIHRASNKHDYQIKYDSNFTANYLMKQLSLVENSSSSDTFFLFGLSDKKLLIWTSTVIGTFFVGVCGIVPVLILPQLADDHTKLVKSPTFNCLVSFAAGTLLGDVFIHLLPEAYSKNVIDDHSQKTWMGIWLLLGLMTFLSIEKLFPDDDDDQEETVVVEKPTKKSKKNKKPQQPKKWRFFDHIKTFGILNAAANIVDNFTHGIAVAGSFQASFKFGVMTLIATLLHEIPHEIGDFAILLKSGLNYREAALAQLTTAFSGILGAIFALNWSSAEEAGNVTSWILPFTSGGFLYIALVNIVPDLLKEKNTQQSLKQILALLLGVLVIYSFNHLF